MKKRYNVEIEDKVFYPAIEADNPEEARQIALEWWIERMPNIKIEEKKNPCLKCEFRGQGKDPYITAICDYCDEIDDED